MSSPGYYAVIPASVRYHDALPPNAKLLYGEITALCNEKGYCWASNSYFAKLYKVDGSTVSEWVSALRKCGFIRVEIDQSRGNERKVFLATAIPIMTDTSPEKAEDPSRGKAGHNNTEKNTTVKEAQSALPLAIEEKTKRFTPPSKQEVEEYFKSVGMNGSSGIEAEKFIAYYDSVGWKRGRTKLTSWKGAAAGWKLRNDQYANEQAPGNGKPAVEEWRRHWPTWCRENNRKPVEYQFAPDHDKTTFWAWLKKQPFYTPSTKAKAA